MRIRHRIPSIFSLSMVDVLCCSLGCVILLWLLNARQSAEEAEDQTRQTAELVEKARIEREQTEEQLATLTRERDDTLRGLTELKGKLLLVEEDRTARGKELAGQRALAGNLQGQLLTARQRLALLEKKVADGNVELEKARKESGGLGKRLEETEVRIRGLLIERDRARADAQMLEGKTKALEQEIDNKQRELLALGRKLDEMHVLRLTLEKSLGVQEKALTLALPYKERWTLAEERVRKLEKELGDKASALDVTRINLASLQGERKALQEAMSAARAAVDNRFAGIEMTGKRVIFLVDISGSMEMVDEKTMAPQKWVEVRNTVARLMRSLPGLEKYQVVTFSEGVSFPLGSRGEWIDNDPKKSPDQVLTALAAVKPKGGTNMYDAFEAVFRYREQGLDTVYLLSDGLPNLGRGLPENPGTMTELERGTVLGRYIRDTLNRSWNAARPGQPRVRINTIGFFFESPDLGAFLWALAREHEGSFVGMSRP